jgi:hypothetical protein
VLEVARQVHGGHATVPQLALDHVAITKCVGQRGVDYGHQSCRVGKGLNLTRGAGECQAAGGKAEPWEYLIPSAARDLFRTYRALRLGDRALLRYRQPTQRLSGYPTLSPIGLPVKRLGPGSG